jgi:hypothetical protein
MMHLFGLVYFVKPGVGGFVACIHAKHNSVVVPSYAVIAAPGGGIGSAQQIRDFAAAKPAGAYAAPRGFPVGAFELAR